MSNAIEVLKKYSTSCSVCKYDGGDQCKASGGEFGECKPAEELSKTINKALLALEKPKFVWVFTDENGNVDVFGSKENALEYIRKDKNRRIVENKRNEIVFVNTYGGKVETEVGLEQEQSYLVLKEVLKRVGEQ